MIIYQSEYITIQYSEEEKLLERHWKPSSAEMNDEQFQHEMLQVLEGIKEHTPLYVLGDTKNFLYVILPDMQIWLDAQVYSQFGHHGVQKMAFVNSEDFYAQLSVEQSIGESNKNYEVRYCSSEEEARAWLFDGTAQNSFSQSNENASED